MLFNILEGKTLSAVTGEANSDTITFETVNGEKYILYHERDCCEEVYVEDICGDLNDLVGTKILLAEEVNSDLPEEPFCPREACLWTFYKISTIKGSVTIRWVGMADGLYSISVDFCKL